MVPEPNYEMDQVTELGAHFEGIEAYCWEISERVSGWSKSDWEELYSRRIEEALARDVINDLAIFSEKKAHAYRARFGLIGDEIEIVKTGAGLGYRFSPAWVNELRQHPPNTA